MVNIYHAMIQTVKARHIS